MNDCLVVGSGPAGVAAAHALVEKGRRVLMLDAGLRLEPDRARAVEAVAGSSPERWAGDLVAPLKEGVEASARGIPLKRLYGSDYPFRGTESAYAIEKAGVDVAPSFALGGLSTVWGAGVLPFSDRDLDGWPAASADLEEHYRAVLRFVPLSGARDDLERLFPIHAEGIGDLPPSRQAEAFLRDAGREKVRLDRAGFTVGRSRLAVDPTGLRRPGCARCGLCLYGCPHRLIYNAEQTVEELRGRPGFEYRGDVVVERVEEDGGRVVVHGRGRASGDPVREEASRAFLAAGVLPTTAIALRSLGRFDRPATIRDSAYFLMPMVRFRGEPGLDDERLHTLAQAFVVVNDANICEEFIHLSLYTYNDLMLSALKKSGGPLGRGFDRLWRALASRTLILGGYLHSRHSPSIRMTLRPGAGPASVRLEAVPNPSAAPMVRRLGRKLLRHARDFRALALTPMARSSAPGRGFHAGGSFPMSDRPGPGESDVLGRPEGFSRVHLADASTFPSVPATTITLAIMANAHRIASGAAGL